MKVRFGHVQNQSRIPNPYQAALPIRVIRPAGPARQNGRMLIDISNQFADIVAAAAPSVVQVHGRRRPASGVVYASGIVLTTTRAIGREDGIQVRDHAGHAVDAELIGWDPATGLAVLKAANLDAAAFTPSTSAVRVGHLALALARSWSNAITASAGIVSVIGGPLQTGRRRSIDQVFRTTAPMHDGFAGGAFLDTTGGLIGVPTAATIRGLGVVVPAATAWKTASTILEHGQVKRGYLGIAGQQASIPSHQQGTTGRERALLVLAVTPGAPAAEAGVMVGDMLLSLDGEPLESPEELMDMLQVKGAGHQAKLQLLRAATIVDLIVAIGQRPRQ
jgi:S1-C subfamily serine protease